MEQGILRAPATRPARGRDKLQSASIALLREAEIEGQRAFAVVSEQQASVYRAVRQAMHCPSEQLLWHGTSWRSAASILQGGFNRAYAGVHGTRLGVGTYFAVNPQYALRFCDDSSPPQALLLARVLVGRYTKGSQGLVEPPVLLGETAEAWGARRYDSTVDDPSDPKAFCVFRDFQALPVGLIAFQS